MCILSLLSKYISVPIFTEWLHKVDILLFDTALMNHKVRATYISLMREYLHLMDGGMFNAGRDMSLLELCGWHDKYGLPCCELLCSIDVYQYDWTLVRQYFTSSYLKAIERMQVFKVNGRVCSDLCIHFGQLKRVQSLTISHSFDVNCLEHWTQLISLTVSIPIASCDIHLYCAVCRNCPLLQSIDLFHYIFEQDISTLCNAVTIHCRNLRTLKCSQNSRYSYKFYVFSLHCSRYLSILDHALYPSDKALSTFLHYRGTNLSQLSLFKRNTFDLSLINICCPALVSLELQMVDSEDYLLPAISLFSSQLTSIQYGIKESSTALAECARCHALKEFTVYRRCCITNDELLAIVRNCPLLEYLNLDDSTGLTEGYLEAIAPYCGKLNTFMPPFQLLVTPLTISVIASHFKQLSSIQLYLYVSPLEICSMLLMIPLLTTLHLSNHPDIDDDVHLLSFESKCKLTSLKLSGCISDAHLYSILCVCPRLNSLNIHHNHMLPPTGLIRAASVCKRLCSLKVLACCELNSEEDKSFVIAHFPTCVLILIKLQHSRTC